MASGRHSWSRMLLAALSAALGLWVIRYSYLALSDPIGFMLRNPSVLELRAPNKPAAWAGMLLGSILVLWPFWPGVWGKKR